MKIDPGESIFELDHSEKAKENLYNLRAIEIFLSYEEEITLSLCADLAKTGRNRLRVTT